MGPGGYIDPTKKKLINIQNVLAAIFYFLINGSAVKARDRFDNSLRN